MTNVAPKRTKQGEKGSDVIAWQKYLISAGFNPGIPDGVHGKKTEDASLAWEKASTAPTVPPESSLFSQHIQSKNFHKVNRKKVDLVVLHSTENPIKPGVAKNVALWFSGESSPRASAHYIVGPDATFRCVREEDVAFAAPGANNNGVQIEQVGQAFKTNWLKDGNGTTDGYQVFKKSAELVRSICLRWDIPMEKVDKAGLLAGKRGITTHAAVSEAFKKSDHVDPGCQGDKRWPWEEYLKLVNQSS